VGRLDAQQARSVGFSGIQLVDEPGHQRARMAAAARGAPHIDILDVPERIEPLRRGARAQGAVLEQADDAARVRLPPAQAFIAHPIGVDTAQAVFVVRLPHEIEKGLAMRVRREPADLVRAPVRGRGAGAHRHDPAFRYVDAPAIGRALNIVVAVLIRRTLPADLKGNAGHAAVHLPDRIEPGPVTRVRRERREDAGARQLRPLAQLEDDGVTLMIAAQRRGERRHLAQRVEARSMPGRQPSGACIGSERIAGRIDEEHVDSLFTGEPEA
jgi:hypothetical protein